MNPATHPHPAEADELASQGGRLARQGRAAEARTVLEAALDRFPSHAGIAHNLAELLSHTGQMPRAEALFVDLLDRDPCFLPAYRSLIPLLAGRLADPALPRTARPALEQRLAVLHNNLGNALLDLGGLEDALAAYAESLRLAPSYPSALSNRANVLRLLGRITEAEDCARAALTASPRFAEAWNNLGTALSEQGRLSEAADCYARALECNPALAEARHNAGSGSLFLLLLREELGVAEIVAAHRRWGDGLTVGLRPAPRRTGRRREKIRVGFYSADFRQHAMLHFVEPLLEHLGRVGEFEIFAYAGHPFEDAGTRRIKALPLAWRPVALLDDAELNRTIRGDDLDLLIDLTGHTRGQRLEAFAARPAPVMAHWLGYTFTSGFPAYDYRITDPWTDPPETAASQHTEQVMPLRMSQFCYRPPADAPGSMSPLPAISGGGGVRFGSCNNVQKMNRAVAAAWSRILAGVPGGRLILRSKLLADRGVAGRIRGLFDAFGTDARQLDLRPHAEDNFAIHREIDLALDPFPYSGATTTCDALWMGVPVVTLAGDRSTGRMGVSILSALGMTDWIATGLDDYVRIAIERAADLEALAATRAGLRATFESSPLRDEAAFAADFARCLREMAGLRAG